MKIPDLATGKVVPIGIMEQQLKDAKNKALRKQQFRHDWLIAISGIIGGGIAGFISSLFFWLITK